MLKNIPQQSDLTRSLLKAGVLSGPLYVGVSLVEMFLQPGFDPTQQSWSLLSNGELGWIHILNFVVTGLLVVAAALGFRRALAGGKAAIWVPLLLGLYGVGLIGSGVFIADPMNGFPIGTPDGPPAAPSFSGLMHIVTGALGFIGLVGACFVLSGRFAKLNKVAWSRFSFLTGVLFLGGFIAIAAGSQQQGTALQVVTLTFTAAVVVSWFWLAQVSLYFMKKK